MNRAVLLVFAGAVLGSSLTICAASPQDRAGAGTPQRIPAPAVVAYLDHIYKDIEAKHPNPTVPPSKGLMKTKPITNDDGTRDTYRAASALSKVLGYDFVKLAVIEHYGREVNLGGRGSAPVVGEGISALVAGLPDGQPGVGEARKIGAMLWLCRHPMWSSYSGAEIMRHTDAYLAAAVPTSGTVKDQGLAVLGAFEQACTIGTPPSKLPAIWPSMGKTMFVESAKVAELTGLPFERVARVHSVNGPLVLWNMVRSLPKAYPGKDAAVAALAPLAKDW